MPISDAAMLPRANWTRQRHCTRSGISSTHISEVHVSAPLYRHTFSVLCSTMQTSIWRRSQTVTPLPAARTMNSCPSSCSTATTRTRYEASPSSPVVRGSWFPSPCRSRSHPWTVLTWMSTSCSSTRASARSMRRVSTP